MGQQARASALRVMLRGTLLEDEAMTQWIMRRYVLAGMMLVDLTQRMLAEVNPDVVVLPHGVYADHGIMLNVLNQQGVRAVIHGQSYRRETMICTHNQTYHKELMEERDSEWTDIDFDEKKQMTIDHYMNQRVTGGMDFESYNHSPLEQKNSVFQTLNLDPHKPVIGLFTNVLWDAQIFYSGNAFDHMLEWMFFTIRHFQQRDDVQLVLRVHPAENRSRQTRQPIMSELLNQFPSLPNHIKVLEPQHPLNSYSLVSVIHTGLVYSTKMSLEMAYRGVPCIIAGGVVYAQ